MIDEVGYLRDRNSELETWLAMMLVNHGVPSSVGWHMKVCAEHAEATRAQMPRGELAVQIGYDFTLDCFTLDAI